ncbi:uncharacterized protein LOC125648384 isoform X1 [Ostrea edulis]|uniref:uncharacterized protein LOC125648384 isoform X1 n=2 Tax=Ostrea edulis TaxID=37623 RepID=UPI0020941FA0|nr:uncharacterized protein LOC125648384 isoform X1 [Ostrea edulis]XP_055998131.1 uncharacterized protein LOC125648384 isoform X1 [Ostrea edulis]
MRRAKSATRYPPAGVHPSELVVKNAVHFIVSNGGQLTISQLLPLIRQHPQLNFLDIGNLHKILQAYPNVFEVVDNRKGKPQMQVHLAFELDVCDQPRKCGGYPVCKALHICKYFIQNKCRENPDRCIFGHSLHSHQNLPILAEYSLDQIDPIKVKEWMQQRHNDKSRSSRPPQVCVFYNTQRGCKNGEECPFLHLCNYFVKRSCKFGSRCSRSHALLSKRNVEILKEHDIDVGSNPDQILDTLTAHNTQDKQFDKFESHPCLPAEPDYPMSQSNMDEGNYMTPGKPFLIEAKSDCIKLQWKRVSQLSSDQEYQIQYKDMSDGRWYIYNQSVSYDSTRTSVSGLKSQSSYSFRIRVIDTRKGKEYPFSLESPVFETPESPALKMRYRSKLFKSGNPDVFRLPTKEVLKARNSKVKSKKLSIGSDGLVVREKTIMLVGATGSGKSTLIDGFANYLFEVNWEDPFRFTLVDLEHEEKRRLSDQALSQTEWITCYSIYPDVASKLDHALHIVDTPGFGDTRGVQRDQEIIDQIREMFLLPGDKGMACLDAVCFLVKAPDARLTPSQKYILSAILSLFGKDMESNICTCITFAEAQEPPVLASLAKSRLPHKTYFKFNNSALFANNEHKDDLAYRFWDIGKRSFDNFFDCLDKMETKSLQMTNEVLKTRQDLENTVHNLQSLITAGMSKISVLEEEMAIFKRHEKEILENKDFVYEVTEQVQEKEDISGRGQHTTNCLTCNYTCHEKCHIPEDSRKDHCVAMSRDGTCTQCPGNCRWQAHHNTPYIIRWVSKKVKKTYREKLQRYTSAQENVSTQKQVLQKMTRNIKDLEEGIAILLGTITDCNNKLKEIALNENPMNTAEYIELMIESEKRERKPGYMDRIRVLEECRQKALIGHEATGFLQKSRQTRRSASTKHNINLGNRDSGSSVISKLHSLMSRA